MAKRTAAGAEPVPLSRERVLRAAVGLADAAGLESLTMRRLAELFGVEAMSLYHHVANKEALLDGVVEVVMGEVRDTVAALDGPPAEEDWRAALRGKVLAARQVMLRHPWAPQVFASRRSADPAVIRYLDEVAGIMRRGGCSYDLVHRALHTLGSRALGFAQELFEPDGGPAPADADQLGPMAAELPYLAGMLSEIAHEDPGSTLGWCDGQAEFEFGLDLILDGLERLRTA
ncbi:TetR/AcrR family transcriptional regulator C-terminal domain-containing protein [Phytomonospora endophytica]|uniref:AcrR family transcriptional regulator n=1 Tax=Phytomonospora endophytica TaxID=714109 RepID=A0A841FL67_9ACTN|nr:TetR/AcrR family transcriptional regulator C-terminal domain-containing protein [Phytomonospora endophytica]MBB6034292.1 AcrR family transcriptional regulator [Phytomonospora endophytica]GIG66686.1 TetR family transcriptional regulator [Phytomonospora endophytica]